jgi:hypothetical protein
MLTRTRNVYLELDFEAENNTQSSKTKKSAEKTVFPGPIFIRQFGRQITFRCQPESRARSLHSIFSTLGTAPPDAHSYGRLGGKMFPSRRPLSGICANFKLAPNKVSLIFCDQR